MTTPKKDIGVVTVTDLDVENRGGDDQERSFLLETISSTAKQDEGDDELLDDVDLDHQARRYGKKTARSLEMLIRRVVEFSPFAVLLVTAHFHLLDLDSYRHWLIGFTLLLLGSLVLVAISARSWSNKKDPFPKDYHWRFTYASDPSPDLSLAENNRLALVGSSSTPTSSYPELLSPSTPTTGINRGRPRGQSETPIRKLPYGQPEHGNAYAKARIARCREQQGDGPRRRDTGDTDEEPCHPNELDVVILQSDWFVNAIRGTTTGEAVWATSIITALHSLHCTILFTSLGWINPDMALTKELYRDYGDLVRVIIADPDAVDRCHRDEDCLAKKNGTDGIPEWKLLSFHYWDHPANPLGPDWTLSPHWTNGNRFISYSIEPACLDQTFVPAAERATNRTYLFAKTRDYLEPNHNDTAWTLDDLGGVIDHLDLDMIAGIRDEDDEASRDHLKSLGIDNKGRLDANSFREYVSSSRLFIGVGRPRISPSPLEALCLGVPFINPIGIYDHEDIWNVTAWNSQHWTIQHMEPPYVYNVFARDIAGLESAIEAALAHPIDSFIPEYMTFDFVCTAIDQVVRDDWQGKYRALEEGP